MVEQEDEIVVELLVSGWTAAKGLLYLEEDYKVGAEKWRVNLSEPDTKLSNSHAQCVARRFAGYKSSERDRCSLTKPSLLTDFFRRTSL